MSRTHPSCRLAASVLATLTLASAGCSSIQGDRLLGVVTPYRVDVMQGNVITQELAAKVQPGMSRGFELQDHSLALYARCTKPDCEFRHK